MAIDDYIRRVLQAIGFEGLLAYNKRTEEEIVEFLLEEDVFEMPELDDDDNVIG